MITNQWLPLPVPKGVTPSAYLVLGRPVPAASLPRPSDETTHYMVLQDAEISAAPMVTASAVEPMDWAAEPATLSGPIKNDGLDAEERKVLKC